MTKIGFDALEGSRPAGDSSLYAEGESTRVGYLIEGGAVRVPRRTAGGGSPAVDLSKGASQFVVNIIDGDKVTSFNPGETDFAGNPTTKDASCPSPQTASPAPMIPSPPTSPAAPLLSPQGTSSSTSATPTPSPGKPTRRPKQPLLPQGMDLNQHQQLLAEVSSLRSQLSSLTSAAPLQPPASISAPSPELIMVGTDFGEISFEVQAIEDRNEDLLLLIWDPKKPKLMPKQGSEVSLTWKDKVYQCQGSGLNLRVALGDQEVLVSVLVLLGLPA